MAFYDLSKQERTSLVLTIQQKLLADLQRAIYQDTKAYFGDEDPYIRKSAYLAMGRIYLEHKNLQPFILKFLEALLTDHDYKIRQSVINAAGEIGKKNFEV